MSTFKELIETMVDHLKYTEYLENRVKKLEGEKEDLLEQLNPGWKKRQLESAMDAEMRHMKQ